MKRYATHRTATAPASRTLASCALALAVVAFLAKRFGLIDADIFVLSFMVAAAVALLAILLALFALHRVWTLGGPGVPAALTGVVLGLLAIGPPALTVAILVLRPGGHDVSTDRIDPPELISAGVFSEQPFLIWFDATLVRDVWPVLAQLKTEPADTQEAAEQVTLYPDIVSRRYRISTAQLHAAGRKALDGLGWSLVDELPPDLLDVATRLQAVGRSQLLGLDHDVALRIRPDPVGALLDVRARSRTPLKDLTGNDDHIRGVFAEIDRVLLETYGDLSRLAVDDSEAEAEGLEPDPVEEPRNTIPLPGFKPYFEEEDAPAPDGVELTDLEG